MALTSCLSVIAGFKPRAALVVLWVCWLSLVNVCTPFLTFQWDVLLIEATFFFIFYASRAGAPPNAAARFVLGWLAAKVTFESGLVKVLGGDPSWRDFTALTYHWWSQPLPTWTIIEGSDDGTTWLAYDFHFKPGRLDVRPKWVAPLQPRLDWQMWFAALSSCGQNPFLINLQQHLLKGTPQVLALLPAPPFAKPPKFIRTLTYEYRFAALSEKNAWWSRTLTGPYCPALTLSADGQLMRY